MNKILNYIIYSLLAIFILWSFIFIISNGTGGATSDKIEPEEIGINIQEIKNNSNQDVIFISIFENNFHKLKPKEEKLINSWLPAADYKIFIKFLFLFKIQILQGSILHPEDRCCVLITKAGLFTLSMGKFHSFKMLPDKNAQVWVKDGQNIIKTIEGHSLVEKISSSDNGNRNLIINSDGLLEMQLSQNPALKKSYPKTFSKPKYPNFEWYKYKLKAKGINLPGQT